MSKKVLVADMVLTVLGVVLTVVSTSMGYTVPHQWVIWLIGGVNVVFAVLWMTKIEAKGMMQNLCVLMTISLAAVCLGQLLQGHAELIDNVLGNGTLKGDPQAVNSMIAGFGAMAMFLLDGAMMLVAGYKSQK